MIYSFISLLLEFIGGPGNVEAFCRDRIIHGTFLHGTCCFPPMQVWHRLLSPPRSALAQSLAHTLHRPAIHWH